jgi:hypothetical protein
MIRQLEAVTRHPKKRTFHEAGVTLTLHDRGTHHELMIGDVPILTTALLGTERAFGRIVARSAKRVVIGGLGFGSTLMGVLETVSTDARVLVVEKLETVVRLHRELGAGGLDDPRVTLVRDDVCNVVARERRSDAILLDVDNGPDWGSFRSNASLYDRTGLDAAKRALRKGGMYAVWSGYPADAFMGRLRKAGFRPRVIVFEEGGRVQARAYVGIAT